MWGVKVLIGKRRALLRVWDITKKDKREIYGMAYMSMNSTIRKRRRKERTKREKVNNKVKM